LLGQTNENPVVVVGGGSGGFHAVESLREHGFTGPITLLSKEAHAPIDRTKLSKALISDPAKLEWRSAADLRIKYGVTLRTGVEVSTVDFAKKNVTLDGGKETVNYGTLILAPGSAARRLPIEGVDLKNVFTLRNVTDAGAIDAACKEGKNLVIIGSSFIGMELAVATAERKMASRHVVSMDKVPFEAVRILIFLGLERHELTRVTV
jgi:apoptosis-inducing factor 3